MVTRLILFLLVALGGAGLTLQAVWNARLRASTTSPVLTALVSVLVTLLSLALVWASRATERGALPAFTALPRYGPAARLSAARSQRSLRCQVGPGLAGCLPLCTWWSP